MDTVAVVCMGIVVAVAAIAGLAGQLFRSDEEARPHLERRRFAGREMLVRKAKFGRKGCKVQPPQRESPQREAYRPKLLNFRKLKQLERPSIRAGDIDFWAAKKGIESRSEALRLLVGMARNTNSQR